MDQFPPPVALVMAVLAIAIVVTTLVACRSHSLARRGLLITGCLGVLTLLPSTFAATGLVPWLLVTTSIPFALIAALETWGRSGPSV